jgi:hypothetical protein
MSRPLTFSILALFFLTVTITGALAGDYLNVGGTGDNHAFTQSIFSYSGAGTQNISTYADPHQILTYDGNADGITDVFVMGSSSSLSILNGKDKSLEGSVSTGQLISNPVACQLNDTQNWYVGIFNDSQNNGTTSLRSIYYGKDGIITSLSTSLATLQFEPTMTLACGAWNDGFTSQNRVMFVDANKSLYMGKVSVLLGVPTLTATNYVNHGGPTSLTGSDGLNDTAMFPRGSSDVVFMTQFDSAGKNNTVSWIAGSRLYTYYEDGTLKSNGYQLLSSTSNYFNQAPTEHYAQLVGNISTSSTPTSTKALLVVLGGGTSATNSRNYLFMESEGATLGGRGFHFTAGDEILPTSEGLSTTVAVVPTAGSPDTIYALSYRRGVTWQHDDAQS